MPFPFSFLADTSDDFSSHKGGTYPSRYNIPDVGGNEGEFQVMSVILVQS